VTSHSIQSPPFTFNVPCAAPAIYPQARTSSVHDKSE
jgi:hypothetical protein